jgi:DNA-binding NarL/FixJ family response regulator
MLALLLIKPGPLRDGLDALLYTIPEVTLVIHANDANAAIDFCKQHSTILIIMEIKPDDSEPLAYVMDMRTYCSQVQMMAIIHDEKDRPFADDAGIDLVISSGTKAADLKTEILNLVHLSPEGQS